MDALMQMSFGYVPAQILYAVAELGVADALADGPQPSDSVAKQTGTDAAALRRLLRAMVGLGLAEQLEADRYALTGLGQGLTTGAPDSMREHLRLAITPELWRAWGALPDAVRSGEAPRDPATGLTAYEAALSDPVLAAAFRTAKAASSEEFAATVTSVYDFSRFRTVAEFGGDQGALMAAILTAVPRLRGIVYDEPAAIAAVTATLAAAGVADRCEVAVGRPAGTIPPEADAYLLNHVIREYPDEAAVVLLHGLRGAMTETTRLLLFETVMPPVLAAEHSATYGLTDLNNLIYTGGRERTADEYGDLLEAAGLSVTGIASAPATGGLPDYNVIEAAARPAAQAGRATITGDLDGVPNSGTGRGTE